MTEKREAVSESVLADRRHAALAIVSHILTDNKYVLVVADGPVSIEGTTLSAGADPRFEIREFADTNPDSEFAVHLHSDASKHFVRHAVEAGMLTLTDTNTGFTRYRLTLNRNAAGKLLAGG